MAASHYKHTELVTWLVKAGANSQALHVRDGAYFTAADVSHEAGAPAAQTAYLRAKAHCSSPGCTGGGDQKCQGCF